MMIDKSLMTSCNPTVWIIIIDQSVEMNGLLKDMSVNKATIAASFVNRLIDSIIQRNFDGEAPKNRCFVSVMGYDHEVKDLCSGWLKELDDNPLYVKCEQRKISDGVGSFLDIEVKEPIWVEATSQKDASASEVALGKANEMLCSYFEKDGNSLPIIFNIMASNDTPNQYLITFNTEWQQCKRKYLQIDIVVNEDLVQHLGDVMNLPFKLYVDGGGPGFCDGDGYRRFYEFNTLDEDVQHLKGCVSLKFDVLENK